MKASSTLPSSNALAKFQRVNEQFQRLRPYNELADHENRVLSYVYDTLIRTGRAASGEEVRFELGVGRALLRGLVERRLLQTRSIDDQFVPSVLGLLYVADAGRDLGTIDRLFRLARERYRPGALPLPRADVEKALGIESAELARIELLLNGRPFENDALPLREDAPASLEAWIPNEYASVFRSRAEAPFPVRLGVGPLWLRLTGLRATRYRALREARLELRSPLTVLVGANGSGKSTCLGAVEFVARAARSGLSHAVASAGGMDRVRTRGTSGPIRLEIDFQVDLGRGSGRNGSYAIAFDELHDALVVEQEQLDVTDVDGRRRQLLAGRRASTMTYEGDAARESLHGAGELGLEAMTSGNGRSLLFSFRQAIASAVLLEREPLRPGSPEQRSRGPFSTDEVLDIERIASDADAVEALSDMVVELVPTVSRVERQVRPGEAPHLVVIEKESGAAFALDEVSSGTRQLLLLSALHLWPGAPKTLLLEEPDASLHVGALPATVDLLRSLAERSTIVATTHSPAFVGLLDPDTEVIALERTDGEVRARPLRDALASRRWLKGFGSTAEAFLRAGAERKL
jgi:predicted ATPase